MENVSLYVNYRCMLCDKVIHKYKFLSRHLNSKIHKQKMEEILRERETMKARNKADKLRELDERLENIIVSYRI